MKHTTEQLKYWLDMIFSEPMRDIITECLESRVEIERLREALNKCEILMSGVTSCAPITDELVLDVVRKALSKETK